MRLNQQFYNQPTLKVTKLLLGKFLVHKIDTKKMVGKIIETEAYIGHHDLASHASRGKTPRTEIMFGSAGFWYIYLIYGMYYCLNIVTEQKNYPAAVLIRAIQPIKPSQIKKTPRVGVDYAGEYKNKPWRFLIKKSSSD